MKPMLSRRDGLAQVTIVLAAVGLYEVARLALSPDWPRALANAHRVADWERRAHLAWELPVQRSVLSSQVLGGTALLIALGAFYLCAHFAGTGVFFVWLYRRSPAAFRRFRNAFMLATAVALLVAWRFPTAPPRVAGLGLEDTLRRVLGLDIGSPRSSGPTDPTAAMPSLHAGWAFGVAVGLVLYARRPMVRALAPLYPAAVVVTVLATGNHFLLDALAGIVVVALSLAVAALAGGAAVVPCRERRGVEQPGSSPGS